jgi:voltage-gated potassium channel
MAVEGLPALDAFYMTVITISTVGFKEVAPLTPGGKFLTILVIFAGLGGGL